MNKLAASEKEKKQQMKRKFFCCGFLIQNDCISAMAAEVEGKIATNTKKLVGFKHKRNDIKLMYVFVCVSSSNGTETEII